MTTSAAGRLKPLRFVRTVLNSFMAESGLEPRLFSQQLRIRDASEGRVDFELTITKDHTNRLKILHGGTIASLVDLGGSLAVASKGYYATGVSTDLNVSYLSGGGKIGDKLTVTAVCDKIGKTLAYTQVTFWDKERNLVARGSHTKFVALAVANSEPFTPPEGAPVAEDDEPCESSKRGDRGTKFASEPRSRHTRQLTGNRDAIATPRGPQLKPPDRPCNISNRICRMSSVVHVPPNIAP